MQATYLKVSSHVRLHHAGLNLREVFGLGDFDQKFPASVSIEQNFGALHQMFHNTKQMVNIAQTVSLL